MESVFRTELDDSASIREDELCDVLKCVICLDNVENAHLCPTCSTLSCFKCFKRWLQLNTPSNCPTCRTSLQRSQLVKCRWFPEIIKLIKHQKEEKTRLKISIKSQESQNKDRLEKSWKSFVIAHNMAVQKNTELEKEVLDKDSSILYLKKLRRNQFEAISKLSKAFNDSKIISKEKDEKISKLVTVIKTNSETISSLKTYQKEQSVIIIQMEKELQDKYQDIVNLKKQEKDKNEAILEKITSALESAETDLKKKDSIILKMEADLKEKDARILKLQFESKERDAAMLRLSNNFTAKPALFKQLIEKKNRFMPTSSLALCTKEDKETTVVGTESLKDISSLVVAGKSAGGTRPGQNTVKNERALLADEIWSEFDHKISELKNAQNKADFIMSSIATSIPGIAEVNNNNNNNVDCNSNGVKSSPTSNQVLVELQPTETSQQKSREITTSTEAENEFGGNYCICRFCIVFRAIFEKQVETKS